MSNGNDEGPTAFIALPDVHPGSSTAATAATSGPGVSADRSSAAAGPESPLFGAGDPAALYTVGGDDGDGDGDLDGVVLLAPGGGRVHAGGQLRDSDDDAGSGGSDDGGADLAMVPARRKRCAGIGMPGPPHVKNIIGCELCERFCYYGLRSILVLYIHTKLGYSDHTSVAIYSYFAAFAYLTPVLGGYISDSYLAKFKTIAVFMIFYLVGSGMLTTSAVDNTHWLAFLGLVFIGLGTGGIKPCVAAFGADQMGSNPLSITSYFNVFYMSINLGSLFSYIFTPLAKRYLGYGFAFSLSTIGLAIATTAFFAARKQYTVHPPTGSVLAQMLKVIRSAISAKRQGRTLDPDHVTGTVHWMDYAKLTHSQRTVEDTKAVWRVLPVMTVLPFFWMLFDQQGSTWTLQAKGLDLYGIEPEQLGVLNPMCLFIPLFEKVLLPCCRRCPGKLQPTPLRRMGLGMAIASSSFVAAAMLQGYMNTQPAKSVSVLWMLPQYALITFAEILVSVTGQEFSYSQAPASMKSIVMAFYFITNAIGDLLTGVLYSAVAKHVTTVQMFLLFALLMLVSAAVFVCVAVWYTPRAVNRPMADDDRLEGKSPTPAPPGSNPTSPLRRSPSP